MSLAERASENCGCRGARIEEEVEFGHPLLLESALVGEEVLESGCGGEPRQARLVSTSSTRLTCGGLDTPARFARGLLDHQASRSGGS
jgi:hypothetical protein